MTSVGAAPVLGTTTTAAAPAAGNAPAEGGIRISNAVRDALAADLAAYYRSADSGDTRMDKIKALRDRAQEGYQALLEGEDDTELNTREQDDLKRIIDWVITGGTGGAPRTYYPPFAAPSNCVGGTGYGPGGAMVLQPTTLWVPVVLQPQHHHLHKFFPKY
jgi:hypothetical protein